jgi:hypothetical protein
MKDAVQPRALRCPAMATRNEADETSNIRAGRVASDRRSRRLKLKTFHEPSK